MCITTFNFYKLETNNHKSRFVDHVCITYVYNMYWNNEIICIHLISLKSKLLIVQINHPSIIIEDMSENILVNSSFNSNTIIYMAHCSTFKSKYRHNKSYKPYNSWYSWHRHQQYKSFPSLCCSCINSGKCVPPTSMAFI